MSRGPGSKRRPPVRYQLERSSDRKRLRLSDNTRTFSSSPSVTNNAVVIKQKAKTLPEIASRIQSMVRNTGGLRYVVHETIHEAKAPEDGRPDVVSRGAVVVTGERRIRCACGEYSGAACRHEPRIYSG
jgi:hypothetical protein